jgi:TRAP-type C4-dicarboxylate transport system substrate-binding protein
LPFFFDDTDDVNENMNGEIGDYLSEKLEPKGIKIISWLENGFRNVTNNRGPVVVPADVAGLKIRVSSAKTNMALFEPPAPVSPCQLPRALFRAAAGHKRGQENPFANIIDKKFYEVQKYLSLTNHVHTRSPCIISMATWNKLSLRPGNLCPGRQGGLPVGLRLRQGDRGQHAGDLRDVIEVNEVDVDAWRALSEEVYKQFEGQYTRSGAQKIKTLPTGEGG